MVKLGRAEEQIDAHKMYMQRVSHITADDKESGWYQDERGNLFHYNGLAWDVVPEEFTKSLEYLG